ncbi:single-stranded-DNA-specific exonuclease RecJ [candidate division WWE3 bacterium RIFCSPHIGHO2_01_FULL_42_13]|uniref:Single-stranded-DNA-specific exonuclease RecJ n=1 Tax=candidate division WWE3 bacterium RIFCSPHIGHO2_01_FULL_42_13 TaxID=1802617 RepID=A0A1F4UQN6_UNCKA|nr:MAG: single-stranded-DNA-specific exonuclease RecJ [candidate division WWE3 bacterium RIFCSPHIGHO2_01_FULL_42_13]
MKWNIKNTLKDKKDLINVLLDNRGITGETEKELFLNPQPTFQLLNELPTAFRKEMQEAKEIINDVISQKLPIVIHGDYDTDGVSSTAILTKVLRNELGYEKIISHIPNRFEHGYGISKSSIEACVQKVEKAFGEFKEGLLISVDSGITAVDAVKFAKERGFKVIITDHHQKPPQLPPADLIVWTDVLVGSGIAWALGQELGSKDPQLLGLAALATVTDLQPVLGFNRSIVKEGLEVLNSNPPLAIKVLREVAGRVRGEITTYDLGWVFGPRINATGRMGDADEALQLLLETKEEKAFEFARHLNQMNLERQDKTLEMYELAGNFDREGLPRLIIAYSEAFHEGIIGLVAAKLSQEYHRPAIVVSLDKDYGKGSARSVTGVDIIAFLRENEDLFEDLGGHPMAAGFTIKREKLEEMEKRLLKLSEKYILDEHLIPVLDVDLEVKLGDVDLSFVEEIEKLKPFGIGNRASLFVSRVVGVVGVDLVGKDRSHLTLRILSAGKQYRAIYFNGAEHKDNISVGDKIDIAFSAERNEYNGNTYVNLVLKDWAKSL